MDEGCGSASSATTCCEAQASYKRSRSTSRPMAGVTERSYDVTHGYGDLSRFLYVQFIP